MSKPCEYCGEVLPEGVDKRTRQQRGAHFAKHTEERRAAEPPAPVAPDHGWLLSGSLLYRLTEERRPTNRDEIRVTMANGSRTPEACARRAGELLDMITRACGITGDAP